MSNQNASGCEDQNGMAFGWASFFRIIQRPRKNELPLPDVPDFRTQYCNEFSNEREILC